MQEKSKGKILLVEDRPEFSKAAKQVFKAKGYEVKHVENYKDAIEAVENEKFDFIFIDGFFPYSKEKLEIFENEELESFVKEIVNVSKKTGKFDVFTDEYFDYLTGSKETPLGLLLAKKLEEKGMHNYLITSAADHHGRSFHLLETYSKEKNLKLYLKDTTNPDAAKSSPEFWEKALEMMEKSK